MTNLSVDLVQRQINPLTSLEIVYLQVIMSRFPQYLSKEKEDELRHIANTIAAPGKGILAADESTG